MKDDIKDPIEFVREVIREVLWNLGYHQQALAKAHKKLAAAKAMTKRAEIDCDAVDEPERDDDDEPFITSVEQLACDFLGEATRSVEYHEQQLKQAHDKSAFATIMLARSNYTEIDLAEIQQEVDEKRKRSGEQP